MQVTAKVLNAETIMATIASKIDTASFKSWISPLELNLDGNTLNLVAQNQFCIDYIKSVYISQLNEVANEYNLVLNFSKKTVNKNSGANDNASTKFELKTPNIEKNNAEFNKFVVCDENAFAVSAARKLAAGGASFSPLYVYGPSGCGKTLLANCVRGDSNGKTVFISGAQFVSEFVRSLAEKSVFAFKDFCRNCDTFILDGINEIAGKKDTATELLSLLLDLRERNVDILITGDTSPSNLSGLDKRLVSLIASGLSADIAVPTVNVKKTMLVRSGVALDVAEMLAPRISSNGHLVMGVANKILTYAELMGERITIDVAEKLLSDTLAKNKTPLSMANEMCSKLGVSYDQICGRGRSKTIVRARQIMMYAFKSATKMSLTEIGRVCGDRDHATVLYAIAQVEKLKSSDLIALPQINQMIEICR